MTCRNCDRHASWISTRCRTCQSRLPAWYVLATVAVLVTICLAFLVVENVF
ncbi:MAG TPA: hypothetical protein VJ749_01490 [Pyrinomonadaceae bacterium]|nr:hypothetical protein [Pyrinomonadaceae bacterium]